MFLLDDIHPSLQNDYLICLKSEPKYTPFQVSRYASKKTPGTWVTRTGKYYFMNHQRSKCKGLSTFVICGLLTKRETEMGKMNNTNLVQDRLQALINPRVGMPSCYDYRGCLRYYQQMRSAIARACPGLFSPTKDGSWVLDEDSYLGRVPQADRCNAILFADLVRQTVNCYDRLCHQAEARIARGDVPFIFFDGDPEMQIPAGAPCLNLVCSFS